MRDTISAPTPVRRPPPRRIWFLLGRWEITTPRLIGGGLFLLVVLGVAVGWHQIDAQAIHARAQQVPTWVVLVATTIAPLVGGPIAIFHIVAGVRFGIGGGLLTVALTTTLHLVVAYTLVRLAPEVFARRLAPWRARIPRGAHGAMTAFACLLPGLPYAVQLYLLPVLGVPLSVLLRISVPLHTLRSVISIVGGDMSQNATVGGVALLIVYYLMLTGMCMLALQRMRHALRGPPAELAARSDSAGR